MNWTVIFHPDFEPEFDNLPEEVQDKLYVYAGLLERFGSTLSRPQVDTLKGSQFAKMKELRFKVHDGVWRVAFAFEPLRQAVLLVAGDKSGVSQKRFERNLINLADQRFAEYLANLNQEN